MPGRGKMDGSQLRRCWGSSQGCRRILHGIAGGDLPIITRYEDLFCVPISSHPVLSRPRVPAHFAHLGRRLRARPWPSTGHDRPGPVMPCSMGVASGRIRRKGHADGTGSRGGRPSFPGPWCAGALCSAAQSPVSGRATTLRASYPLLVLGLAPSRGSSQHGLGQRR